MSRMTEVEGVILPVAWLRTITALMAEPTTRDTVVVIRGEPGTGKSALARVVHAVSPRRSRPFLTVRCAGRSAEQLEVELFGHESHALPGEPRRRLGRLEFADSGTLFLEEVDRLPAPVAARVAEVIVQRRARRLGGVEEMPVDVQLVASTCAPLPGSATCGEPSGWRLRVLDIEIRPLRERREEIALLASAFLARFNARYRREVELPAATLALFADYPWPGNTRELADTVHRAVLAGTFGGVHRELEARLRTAEAGQSA